MCHRYVIDTPGLLHTSPDGSTANAVQTSQRTTIGLAQSCATRSHLYQSTTESVEAVQLSDADQNQFRGQ